MIEYIPLKKVLPKGMDAKTARRYLRDSEFSPHDGKWEFPKRRAEKVEEYLIEHR